MNEKKSSGAFFWGFIAGAAAAGIYTLLKTPRSGREMIEQVKGQGVRLKSKAEEMTGAAMRQSGPAATDWQYTSPATPQYWQADLHETAQQAQGAADDAAQAVGEQAAEAIEAAQAEAGDAADAVKQALES